MGTRTLIGGQAVIEGVMMRAPRSLAVAVRLPGGKVVVKKDSVALLSERFPFLRRPFIRGVPALFSSLVLGIRALNYSAARAMEEEQQEGGWILALSTAVALAGGVALFFYLPLLMAQGLVLLFPSIGEGMFFNAVDGTLRLAVFLFYIALISRWGEIRRVFEYHGAEHMAVWAYEHGRDLTVAAVREQSPIHPRCGTSFLLIVMVVSILLFSLIPGHWPLWGKFLSRILLLPALAAISFEIVRKGGESEGRRWLRVIGAPGLWLQRLTTKKPDDSQIEVALEALKAVLSMEGVSGSA